MFDDNTVRIFRRISSDNIDLEYKRDGELIKEMKVQKGQKWKVRVKDELCHVEIEEFINEGIFPVTAILKTDSKVFEDPALQMNDKPAYPVLTLVSDGEQVKDEK